MADDQVKLHGSWVSLYSFRVMWALEIKGISYESIEEDFLYNKSQLLLQYNPVHKKIPVIVHGGKPVCESMIVVEYIEETWPHNPLLPHDPYERALARFWVKFVDDKGPAIWRMFKSRGEEHEKAKTESLEMLRTMEQHALGDKKFFGGDEIGIVDIAFGGFAYWLGVVEEVVGVKLFEDQAFPRLHAWINDFKQVSVIKRNLPDRHRMLVFYKDVREKLLGFTSS